MNNKFSDYVKKTKIKVLMRLVLFILLVTIAVVIRYMTNNFLVIPGCLVLFGVVVYFMTDKERNQKLKYKLRGDEPNTVYIPLTLDNEYLKNISNGLNSNITLPNSFDNLVSYVQYMIDNNQMIFVTKKFKLDDIVNLLNNLMRSRNINYSLNVDDITANDNDIIKLRRKDNVMNDAEDLNMIRYLLEQNGLDLICFFALDGGFSKLVRVEGYILTIVPINKVSDLKKYQIKSMNK